MAIVFIDGFDHYPISQMTRKWTSSTVSTSMGAGRTGGQSLGLMTTQSANKVFSSTSQAWRIGFALKLNSQTGSAFQPISLRDGGTSQVELSWLADRRLQFSRNGTLIGSSGPTTLLVGVWYYVEFYISIKDSTLLGNGQLYLNGVQELNLPGGSDTKNTANAFADRVQITGGAFWDFNIDDFVVSQEADTTTPTFLGDRKVVTLYPDGTGNYSGFSGSDGNSVNNYQLVDETTVDDADFVTSDVAGTKDSYTFQNPGQTPAVVDAVQISACVRKDDAGARTGRLFFRAGGSDYEGSDIALSTSFVYSSYIGAVNPATGLAWTPAELLALEAGVKVQS